MNNNLINKSLVGKGLIYLISNILNAFIPFLLLPILTRVLTPEDYGVIAIFLIFLTFTNAFVGLSVEGAINVQYFKLDREKFSEYVGSCISLLLVSAVLVFVVIYFLGPYIESAIGLPYKWMLAAVGVSLFQFFIAVRLAIWMVSEDAVKYGAFQLSLSGLNAILSLVFVIVLSLSWEGRLLGHSLSIAVFGLMALFLIWKSGTLKRPTDIFRDMADALSFGLPLIPHVIGTFVIYNMDRIIISKIMGASAVGIYMVGLQLGQVIGLIAGSYNKVYAPWLMKNLSNETINKEHLVKYSYLSMLALISAGIGWAIIGRVLLPFIVGDEFQSASSTIIYMCLGFSFGGCYYVVTNYVFYSKKTKWLAGITFFCGLANIPVTFLLASSYGINGAAIAFLAIQLLFFLLTWLLAARVCPVPWFYFLRPKA